MCNNEIAPKHIQRDRGREKGRFGSWLIEPLQVKNKASVIKEDRREIHGAREDWLSIWLNRLLKK